MKNIDAMKQTLKELCAIPSVQGTPEAGKPFGAEVNRALEYFLKTAENFGFETINYDGYAGEVIWRGKNGKNGEPAEELGILDKVLENGWKSLSAKETGRIGGLMTGRKK